MLEHAEEGSKGKDKQKEIDGKCKELFRTCKKIVEDYGTEEKPRVRRKFLHFLSNTFISPDPTKLPSKKFTSIQQTVFVKDESGEKWHSEEVEISIIEDQIQITAGDKNGERLVLGEHTSWIQPQRQPSAPKPVRRVTEADLQKYGKTIDLVRTRLIFKN